MTKLSKFINQSKCEYIYNCLFFVCLFCLCLSNVNFTHITPLTSYKIIYLIKSVYKYQTQKHFSILNLFVIYVDSHIYVKFPWFSSYNSAGWGMLLLVFNSHVLNVNLPLKTTSSSLVCLHSVSTFVYTHVSQSNISEISCGNLSPEHWADNTGVCWTWPYGVLSSMSHCTYPKVSEQICYLSCKKHKVSTLHVWPSLVVIILWSTPLVLRRCHCVCIPHLLLTFDYCSVDALSIFFYP